jgi:ATP-binding cassette, subfamily B, bacterial
MYKKLFQIFSDDKRELSGLYFFAILSGIVQLILPLGIQSIVSYVMGGFISTSIVVLIIIVLMSVIADGALHIEQMKLIERIQQKVYVRYSKNYSNKLKTLDLFASEKYNLPERYNTYLEISILQKGVTKLLLEIPVAIISIIFGLILLSFYNGFFVFFGLILLAFAAGIIYFTGGRGIQSSIEESNYKYKLVAWFQQVANFVYQMKFFSKSNLILEKTDKLTINYLQNRNTHFRVLLTQYKALVIFKILLTGSMLIVGTILLVSNQINIGQFIASEIIILLIIGSVEKLIVNLDTVYDMLTSIQKLEKVTDLTDEAFGTLRLVKHEPLELKIDQLKYDKTNVVSLLVKHHSKVAIGFKEPDDAWNIINSICGFKHEGSNSIFWNGLTIKNYNLESLRQHIIVFDGQHKWLDLPIHDNLDLNISKRDKLDLDVLKYSGLQKHVDTFDKGLDEIVYNSALKDYTQFAYSLQLARVLSVSTDFLILFEPFRFIDDEDNKALADYLHKLPAKTMLVFTNNEYFLNRLIKLFKTWKQ